MTTAENATLTEPAPGTTGIAVELRDVVKRFGEVTAVDHVSLRIGDGEFFSLLGPSGCGKTTSLRMIAGFDMPSAGQVFIGGALQGYLPPYQRPVNTVFQNYALFPHMSVYQNVAFGLEMQQVARAEVQRRVGEALDLVRLHGMEQRRPKQLSGGQQQRVALARALVNRPKVLLLDEPLGALDLKLRKNMQIELQTMQDEVGITFVYVTHDQEEALTMSDRIAVMDRGTILQIGRPQEIYEHPHNRFVANFIGETNFIPGTVEQVELPAQMVVAGSVVLAEWIAAGLAAGDGAVLSIRPEKIQLLPPEDVRGPVHDGSTTCVPGQITHAIYLGTDTRYQVRLSEGVELFARLQNVAVDGAPYHVGDAVAVCWDASHARILKE